MVTIETVKQTCDRKVNQQLMGLPFFTKAKKNIFRVKVAKILTLELQDDHGIWKTIRQLTATFAAMLRGKDRNTSCLDYELYKFLAQQSNLLKLSEG